MNTLKKIIRTLRLDAMTPEFKAANAELLKAIKMNDKSGAVPHVDLEAVNKAMKENDAEKVGTALKKVQLQFSKAEKKLDDEVKDVTARLAEAKNAVEKSKIDLKASKADAALFDKARKAADGIKANPRNASKLSPIADKLKKYGDLSKRVSQIVTLAASNKDVSKQVDMLKKAIDTAEKKYKKEAANVEKEAKKAKDELDVLNMRVKVTQGKKDAFQKERLYIANVVKQMPSGDLRQALKLVKEAKWNTIKDWFYVKSQIGAFAFSDEQIVDETEKALKVRTEVRWKPGVTVVKDIWVPKSVVNRNIEYKKILEYEGGAIPYGNKQIIETVKKGLSKEELFNFSKNRAGEMASSFC